MQSNVTSPPSSSKWQDELAELARAHGFQKPVYDVYSDRRVLAAAWSAGGGRTAWSASVRVEAWTCAARFWYDGPYVNNAREEAAEALVQYIRQQHHWNEVEFEREASTGLGSSAADPEDGGSGGSGGDQVRRPGGRMVKLSI